LPRRCANSGTATVSPRQNTRTTACKMSCSSVRVARRMPSTSRTSDRLDHDILRVAVRVFCLGETVAVPLFKHMRERCTVAVARDALDRILRDEVRHRDFGWDLLDWLDQPALVTPQLPAMLAELAATYGTDNPAVSDDDGQITDDDRAWGLAPPRDYAHILARTIDKDFRPRFAARNIAIP